MPKSKTFMSSGGFALTEVLVAILITTVFVATAMQAMVIAAVMKAKARQHAEAITWIQRDLEIIKYSASRLQNSVLATNALAGATTLQVNSVYGFVPGDKLAIGSANYTIASGGVNSTTNPPTLTLTSGLLSAQSAGSQVTATTKCNAASQDTGFAHHLRTNLPNIYSEKGSEKNTGQITISGQAYQITRDGPENDASVRPNVKDDAFEILMIKYDVKPSSGGDTVATLYTEVIPDAAFQCP